MTCDHAPFTDRLELKTHTISEHQYAYCEFCESRLPVFFTEEYQAHAYTHNQTKCKLCFDWVDNLQMSDHLKEEHLFPKKMRQVSELEQADADAGNQKDKVTDEVIDLTAKETRKERDEARQNELLSTCK